MNLRLFVALDPPEPARRRLAAMQAELRHAAGRHADEVRWMAVENVHLTLQFLGAVPEERLAALRSALPAVGAEARPLALEVKGAGGFPSPRRPRVVWVGVGGEVEVEPPRWRSSLLTRALAHPLPFLRLGRTTLFRDFLSPRVNPAALNHH